MVLVVEQKKTVYRLKSVEGARMIVSTVNVEEDMCHVEVTAKDVEVENVLKFAG